MQNEVFVFGVQAIQSFIMNPDFFRVGTWPEDDVILYSPFRIIKMKIGKRINIAEINSRVLFNPGFPPLRLAAQEIIQIIVAGIPSFAMRKIGSGEVIL